MNLYDINKEIQNLFDNMDINEETGEVAFDENKLAELELAKEEKIEATALYIRSIKAEKDALRTEKQRLTKKLEALDRKEDRLKEYLAFGCNKEKFKTPLVTVSFRNLDKPIFANEEEWMRQDKNQEYINATVKLSIDNKRLTEDLKSGKEIPGVALESKTSVTIR